MEVVHPQLLEILKGSEAMERISDVVGDNKGPVKVRPIEEEDANVFGNLVRAVSGS